MTELGELRARIRGLHPGWTIIDYKICGCGREAIILCEKSNDRPEDTQFVTWETDLVNGGCYSGHYFEKEPIARVDLAQRRV